MKKGLKKLSLNKKGISNLSEMIKGGIQKTDTTQTSDATKNTICFNCPQKTTN